MWIYVLIVVLLVGSSIFLLVNYLRNRVGKVSHDRRALDLALVKVSQTLKQNPNDAHALAERGIIRIKKGDTKGGMADLHRSLEVDPTNVKAHYHFGMGLYQAGQFAAAGREFDWIMSNSEDPFFKTAVRDKLNDLRAKKYR